MKKFKDLYIDAGEDYSITLTVYDDNLTVMDLTDFTIKSQLSKSFESPKIDFVATIINESEGIIKLEMTKISTSLLKGGRYFYDVEVTSDTNITKRVYQGTVFVEPEITST